MRLYSDSLTSDDVRRAFHFARATDHQDIYLDSIRTFQPRNGGHGVEFYAASVNGKRASGHAPIGSYPRDGVPRAASWTAYGYVIARLFRQDPNARIGYYSGREDFASKVTSYTPRGQSTEFLAVAGGETS